MPSVAVVIPARLESERLKNKLMLDVCGKPLLWYTMYNACELRGCYKSIDIAVATDSQAIYDFVGSSGLDVEPILTSPNHTNGTSRVCEVAKTRYPAHSVVVNLQGDEPGLYAKHLVKLIDAQLGSGHSVSTLASAADPTDYHAHSVVKVVFDANHFAMYFSRMAIPCNEFSIAHKHVGVYAFKRQFIDKIIAQPSVYGFQGPLEPKSYLGKMIKGEQLEQLVWLYYGHKVKVVVDEIDGVGVDTKEEYLRFVELVKHNKWLKQAE